MASLKVLTIDDEEHIQELLKYNLEKNGYEVFQAFSGEDGIEILKNEKVDIVLLDWMLPNIDGLEVLRIIRSDNKLKSIPVIMLTAKNEEIDTVLGLEIGADDYIGKPFGTHELNARIKAVLRRSDVKNDTEQEDEISMEDININRTTRIVEVNGKKVELPLKEFELLWLLAKNQGRVFDRDFLLEKIWGYEYFGESRTVDVHIRNLRKKIEIDDKNPIYIKTVRGVGYKFK